MTDRNLMHVHKIIINKLISNNFYSEIVDRFGRDSQNLWNLIFF